MKHARFMAALLVAGTLGTAAAYALGEGMLAAEPDSQTIQNARADADDLSRMQNYPMLLRFRTAGLLVPVPASGRGYYLYNVPSRYRYLRPWAKLFLTRLSRQFNNRFGARLRVTALVRTVAYQKALARRNPNAAAAVGDLRSSHLTGATLDISKRFMKPAHTLWMRRVLYSLHERRVIYGVEEFRQPVFHVMVHKSYRVYVREITN